MLLYRKSCVDSSEIWWKSNCIDKLDAVDRVKKVRCSCRDCIVEMLDFAVQVKTTEQLNWFMKNELLPMKQACQQMSDRQVSEIVEGVVKRGTRWRRKCLILWALLNLVPGTGTSTGNTKLLPVQCNVTRKPIKFRNKIMIRWYGTRYCVHLVQSTVLPGTQSSSTRETKEN